MRAKRVVSWLAGWVHPVGLDWPTAALLGAWFSAVVGGLATWGVGGPVPAVVGSWVVLGFNLAVALRERARHRAELAKLEADLFRARAWLALSGRGPLETAPSAKGGAS